MMKRSCNERECNNGNGSCARANAQSAWMLGIGAIVLVTIASVAMFSSTTDAALPTSASLGQQAGFFAGSPGGAGSALYAPTQHQMAPLQQVALPSGCATCPSVAQCFPQGAAAQQAAFARGGCLVPGTMGALGAAGQQAAMTQPQLQTTVVAAPPITRQAIMPHEYRGVCSNCHAIMGSSAMPQTVR